MLRPGIHVVGGQIALGVIGKAQKIILIPAISGGVIDGGDRNRNELNRPVLEGPKQGPLDGQIVKTVFTPERSPLFSPGREFLDPSVEQDQDCHPGFGIYQVEQTDSAHVPVVNEDRRIDLTTDLVVVGFLPGEPGLGGSRPGELE